MILQKSNKLKGFLISLALIISFLNVNYSIAEDEESDKLNADTIYFLGLQEYSKSNYEGAIKEFETLERKYPNHILTKQAIIMQVFCHYLNQEYEKAISTVDVYLATHPISEINAYLDFMKSLSVYRQISGINKSRDMTLNAMQSMLSTSNRYQGTIFGDRAAEYVSYLQTVLDYNEILEGEVYQINKNFFAAIRRYNDIIIGNKYNLLPIAYYRLFECYSNLNMQEMASFYKKEFEEIMQNFTGVLSFKISKSINYESKNQIHLM